MQVDASELTAWADDIADRSVRNSKKVVASTIKAAVNIRNDVRGGLEGSRHYPQLGRALTYDVDYKFTGAVVVEIGYDKDLPQGPLGNIREYGSASVAPHGDLARAFDREVPVWMKHVEADAGDL